MIRDMEIQVIRKTIKNFHLAVLPPYGKVRVAVPHHVTDERVRLAIISKLAWIRRQQADFNQQPRQTEREMINGESHYLWGRQYRLEVIEQVGKHRIEVKGKSKFRLYVQAGTSADNRLVVLNNWYREQLKVKIDELIEHWSPIIKRKPKSCGIRKMKTKWGSCNIETKRILFNLELVKKPPECLEYIYWCAITTSASGSIWIHSYQSGVSTGTCSIHCHWRMRIGNIKCLPYLLCFYFLFFGG